MPPDKIIGWGAVLQGHPFDLDAWADMLRPGFDPWVERNEQDEGSDKFILRSTALDGLISDREAREKAEQMIAQLNGAMWISSLTKPVNWAHFISFHENGVRRNHYVMSAQPGELRLRGHAATLVDGPEAAVHQGPS